jgi:hypothetical protein
MDLYHEIYFKEILGLQDYTEIQVDNQLVHKLITNIQVYHCIYARTRSG